MSETVVRIMNQMNSANMGMILESASGRGPHIYDYCPLKLDLREMPSLNTRDEVSAYGRKLREALYDHPAIKSELEEIFGLAPPKRSRLKFLIQSPYAEGFRWESLCAERGKFLALSDVCTISRVTPTKSPGGLRTFAYPLRMVAFLSAARINAEPELDSISKMVKSARADGLNVECIVYLGERQILDDIQNAQAARNSGGVTVKQIPPTATEITNLLKDTPIQLLHFFCHGISRDGVPGLSLATIGDHDNNAAEGSIYVAADALSEALAQNNSIWITVLNSCSGAEVPWNTQHLHSMAFELTENGCPYVVGMAEPIDRMTATTFSNAFYRELFTILRSSLAPVAADGRLELDLSPAVIPARKMIHDRYSDRCAGCWLLPVLYEEGRPLSVLDVKDTPLALIKRSEEVARVLRALPEGTPPLLRGQILKVLDNPPRVPESVRPNLYGVF